MEQVLVWIIIVGGVAIWLSRTIQGKGGNCPSCGKGIKSNAYVCHHCGRDKRTTA